MANPDRAGKSGEDAPPDLSRERDELLDNFRKGSQLTQEFLDAYDRLQLKVLELQSDNTRLRAAVEADDAIQQLITKISALESDKQSLLTQTNHLEASLHSYPTRVELEAELASFANLHVACNCLHNTLAPQGVGLRIKEILEQLVGVEAYVIYLGQVDPVPVTFEGLQPSEKLTDSPIVRLADVCKSGVSSILEEKDPSAGTISDPCALIPLRIDEQVVGVLSIVRSLSHKTQLTTVDYELFKLLGQHAAAALMAAGLYEQAGQQFPPPEAFGSLQH